jgi:hypothetical protein
MKRTFDELAKVAAMKGYELERGMKWSPLGMRSGYILWNRGLWTRYNTLADVAQRLGL